MLAVVVSGQIRAGHRTKMKRLSDDRQLVGCVQAEDLQKRASKQRERLDLSLSSTWRSFQDLVACLVACNALQPESLSALPLGHVARQIHGENELWLAMVLTHPAVQVSHSALVLLTCNTVTAPPVSQVISGYHPLQSCLCLHTA